MMRFFALALLLMASAALSGSLVYAALSDEASVSGTITVSPEFSGGAPGVNLAAIDVDIDASPPNTPTSFGSIETCASIPSGETIEIDVLIESDIGEPGIEGIEFDLAYDAAVLEVVDVNNLMLLDSGGKTVLVDFTDFLPDNDGEFSAAFGDFGPNTEEDDGVLSRITIRAIAAGVSDLEITYLNVENYPYRWVGDWTTIEGASIYVDSLCPGATATPVPSGSPASPTATPSPAPTLAPTATPDPDRPKFVAIDTQIGSNTATSFGEVDPCVSIASGEEVQVDLVMQAVTPPGGLVAYQAFVHYDSDVLEVVSWNNNMLLAAGGQTLLIDLTFVETVFSETFLAIAAIDFGPNSETGDGVLSRVTFRGISSGSGTIELSDVLLPGEDFDVVDGFAIENGAIYVDSPCPGATATLPPSTSFPSPTPTPTATPTPAPPASSPPSPAATATATATPTATPTSTVAALTSTPAPTPPPAMSADADCSGDVDAYDALTVLLNAAIGAPLPCPSAADTNCDGLADLADVLTILYWLGGLPVTLPAGCPAIATA